MHLDTSDQLICNTDIFGKSLEEAMELEVPNSQFPQEIPLALDLIFCCLEMKSFVIFNSISNFRF